MRKNDINQKASQICRLYRNGKSFLQIAKIIHTATISIQKILKQNHVKIRPSGINIGKVIRNKKDILAALNKCGTAKQAAMELGMDKSTLYSYINKYAIKRVVIKVRWS